MKTVFEYSHLGGAEILRSRYAEIDESIDEAIRGVGSDFRTKLSREKGRRFGTMLYDPKSMNRAFEREFTARGFSEIKRSFDVDVPGWKNLGRGWKQIDFSRPRAHGSTVREVLRHVLRHGEA